MGNNLILDKSFNFSVKIVNLYRKLVTEKKEYILSKQLLRSGTSIGANVKEGISGVSKSDFKNKLGIALKEAKETEYWLELMVETNILTKEESIESLSECNELCRILSSIIISCNENALNVKLKMQDYK
ncbi:MAG: four helix bundle protein [Clostridium sp.]|uniref:four helix bundle protein n=1 Tax=Clostridium sp. TaxID=1506 RepID=UPI0032168BF7